MKHEVGAMIVADDRLYILQHRDDIPGIKWPGMIGFFGGAVERGETKEEALKRELWEELEFIPDSMTKFMEFKNLTIFDVKIKFTDTKDFVLHEGQGLAIGTAETVFTASGIIPCVRKAIKKREKLV